MGGYVGSFIVYTAAMIGVIYAALFVYKKSMTGFGQAAKTRTLNIEETMSLTPRKTLYIVKAGNERFLIASDVDKTSLISQLDAAPKIKPAETPDLPDIIDFQEARAERGQKTSQIVQDFQDVVTGLDGLAAINSRKLFRNIMSKV